MTDFENVLAGFLTDFFFTVYFVFFMFNFHFSFFLFLFFYKYQNLEILYIKQFCGILKIAYVFHKLFMLSKKVENFTNYSYFSNNICGFQKMFLFFDEKNSKFKTYSMLKNIKNCKDCPRFQKMFIKLKNNFSISNLLQKIIKYCYFPKTIVIYPKNVRYENLEIGKRTFPMKFQVN